jgi:hypothetical protein
MEQKQHWQVEVPGICHAAAAFLCLAVPLKQTDHQTDKLMGKLMGECR